MPRFSFDPKISLGNVLAIVTMIGGLWGFAQAYGSVISAVDEHSREIAAIKAAAIEQGKAIEADRIFAREALAELRTDIRYIRRYLEDANRGAVVSD